MCSLQVRLNLWKRQSRSDTPQTDLTDLHLEILRCPYSMADLQPRAYGVDILLGRDSP